MTTTAALFSASDAINGSIPAAAYGSADLGATFFYPGPSNTWVDTGLAVTLDSNGVWEVRGQLRAVHRDDNNDVVFGLFDDAVSTTVPVAGSETQPGFVEGTNNATDAHQTTGALLFRHTVMAAPVTLKLRMKVATHVASSAALLSDGNGRSRLVWEKVSGFTPLDSAIVMETGEAQLATGTQVIGTTEVDLAGCVTPVLAAGLWRIDMYVTGTDTAASDIYCWLADQADNVLDSSSVTVSNDGGAASHGASAHISIDVASDGSARVKMRARSTASTTIRNIDHTLNANAGSCTKIRWTKIASNVPVSNSSESVVSVSDNGSGANQTTTATNTNVPITNASIVLPTPGEWEVTLDNFSLAHSVAGTSIAVSISDDLGTVLAERVHTIPTAGVATPGMAILPSITITAAKRLQASVRALGAGTTTITNANTALSKPRFSARKVGGLTSIPGTVAEVSGAVSLASNQVTAANTTPVDSGLSFIAPEAGTYEVGYEAPVSNSSANGATQTWIADASNNQQGDSFKRGTSATANATTVNVGSCRMVMAAGDVAKLRMASAGVNVSTMYGDLNGGKGTLKWRKVAGYVAGPASPHTYPAGGPVTALGSTAQVGTITRVDSSNFNTAGGLIVGAPLVAADGDWFGICDEGGQANFDNKQIVVRFTAGQPLRMLGANGAHDYIFNIPSAVKLFYRMNGSWRPAA